MKPKTAAQRESTAPDSKSASAELRANRYDVLSRLADELAHEIRNPLNALVVNLEVLRGQLRAGHSAPALERVQGIEQEIRRLHGLIEQLLKLLRPDTRQATTVVGDLLDQLGPVMELQARAAHVKFDWRSADELHARISADALRFALLTIFMAVLDRSDGADSTIELRAESAEGRVRITLLCSQAQLSAQNGAVAHARTLLEPVGGILGVEEPHTQTAGSRISMVLPPADSHDLLQTERP